MRAVVFSVLGQHAFHFFGGLKVVVRKNARPGREGAQPEDVAGVHQILVGKHIVRAGLHIEASGDAVREVCEERPVLRVQDAAPDFGPVRVGVNEARHDRFAAHIEHFGARRRAALRADAFDAVALDDDVGVL